MLNIVGYVLTMDMFGSIVDNEGGIVKMNQHVWIHIS
jgi:Na+/H+-translocating membrane pyrophosphatase